MSRLGTTSPGSIVSDPDRMRTMNMSPEGFRDADQTDAFSRGRNDTLNLDKRDCFSKSPVDFNSLTINSTNRTCLLPLKRDV